MNPAKIILDVFDVKKGSKICNYRQCQAKPTKEGIIYKYNRTTGKNILATIYMCTKHQNKIDLVKKQLKNKTNNIIDFDIKSI